MVVCPFELFFLAVEVNQVIVATIQKEFEDTKGYSESGYRRTIDNTMARKKSSKGQTTIYKAYTLRKLCGRHHDLVDRY
jgi:hypothetical protein